MGRTKVVLDKHELVSVINQLENEHKFSNRSELFKAVADQLPNVSASVVLLRVKEFNIALKTPKGQRGRPKGVKLTQEQKDAMQKGRQSRTISNTNELLNYFPSSRHGLIRKVGKGSLSAAIKAKCLDCCNQDTKEITVCNITSCPLWGFRPYQNKSVEE